MYGPEFGDCIGSESCTNSKSDAHAQTGVGGDESNRMRRRRMVGRQFPPPIPSLANQPWMMRKYATDDGRLIIREERIECQEYFRAERSNGRLVMNLVHLEESDTAADEEGGCAGEKDDLESDGNGGFCGREIIAGDDETAAECCTYNAGRMNHCGGFVLTAGAGAPTLRPPTLRPPLHT